MIDSQILSVVVSFVLSAWAILGIQQIIFLLFFLILASRLTRSLLD